MTRQNRTSGAINPRVSPESIPVTIPADALEAIGEGYEFTETLAFPQTGSGGVYNRGVFDGVLDALKSRPIPGDKRGHSENPNDDFFVIGGKIEGNEAHFRVRVPETDYAGMSNEGFIRSLKTGNQKLSLVLDVADDGSGQFNALRSDHGLRNDAVGTLPAMGDQTIHANSAKGKELLSLAKSGKICESGSDDLIVGGSVNLTAVRKIQPLDNPLRNMILSAAKNKTIIKENKMEIDEEKLKAMIASAAKEAVAAVTDQQTKDNTQKKNAADIEQAKKILELAKDALGEEAADLDAEEVFSRLVAMLKSAEDAAAEAEANKFVGAGLRKNKEGKDTPLFIQVKKEFLALGHGVLIRKNCEKEHEKMRNNEVFKALRQAELNPNVTHMASDFPTDGSF
jgi:hypothetical protein